MWWFAGWRNLKPTSLQFSGAFWKLNVEKAFSISIGIGVVKVILISLTAISFSCDFSIFTFVFFKNKQWNARAFCVFKKYNYIDAEWWRVSGIVWSTFFWNCHGRIHNFEIEVITSLSAINPLIVKWRQETSTKNIAEVIKTSNAAVEEVNQSEEELEIVPDGDENRKITAVEALEVNGSDHLNMIFY